VGPVLVPALVDRPEIVVTAAARLSENIRDAIRSLEKS